MPALMLCIRQMLFNKLIFPRSLVLPSEMDSMYLDCVFPPLPPCVLLLPQDASTSLGLKIDISPWCSLSLTLFSWGNEKHTYCAGGTEAKTITFMIQWQIRFCLCRKKRTRRNKGPNKKAFYWGLDLCGSLFFIELTHWALIFEFHFGFYPKLVLAICCTGLQPTYSSRSLKVFWIPKWKTNAAKYLNRSFYGRLIITALQPYGYWFLTGCCWPQFIFLIFLCAHTHTPRRYAKRKIQIQTHSFLVL